MAAQNWAMRAGQKYASFGSSGLLWACGNDQTETQSQDRTPSQMLAAFPKYLIILYGVKFLWVRYERTNSEVWSLESGVLKPNSFFVRAGHVL